MCMLGSVSRTVLIALLCADWVSIQALLDMHYGCSIAASNAPQYDKCSIVVILVRAYSFLRKKHLDLL